MNDDLADVWEILRSLDDPDHLWFPVGYDYDLANSRARDLGTQLERDFRCDIYLLTSVGVQDATFRADIGIPAEATATGKRLWVRVSNHGPLAVYGIDTVRASNHDADIEAELHPDDRTRLENALAKHGYTIVSNDPLREPYDGHNDIGATARTRHSPGSPDTSTTPNLVCLYQLNKEHHFDRGANVTEVAVCHGRGCARRPRPGVSLGYR